MVFCCWCPNLLLFMVDDVLVIGAQDPFLAICLDGEEKRMMIKILKGKV